MITILKNINTNQQGLGSNVSKLEFRNSHEEPSKVDIKASAPRNMTICSIGDSGLERYNKINIEKEKFIEEFIEKNPQCLRDGLFIIGRQVRTDGGGIVDLVGLDSGGNVTIIEIKKGTSHRQTVSQILEYAVWAERLQYDSLNEIAANNGCLDGFADLYKRFEKLFGTVPDPFNQNQTLYIVAPKIDEMTADMSTYLSMKEVQIKCIEFNMYENRKQKVAIIDMIVGNEDITDDLGRDDKERVTWKDKLLIASEENRKNVEQMISKMKDAGVAGSEHGQWYQLTIKDGMERTKVAVIVCGKNTSHVAIRTDPETFEIEDERIRYVKGWFFRGEIRISLVPENFELILSCIENHSLKVANSINSTAGNKAAKAYN